MNKLVWCRRLLIGLLVWCPVAWGQPGSQGGTAGRIVPGTNLSSGNVTATGGTTARTLADWFANVANGIGALAAQPSTNAQAGSIEFSGSMIIPYCPSSGCGGINILAQYYGTSTTISSGQQETVMGLNQVSNTGGGISGSGKEVLSMSQLVSAGSGPAWVMDTDQIISAGTGNLTTYGYELDTNNFNADAAIGSGNGVVGLFLGGGNSQTYAGTTAILVSSGAGTGRIQWHDGILFQDPSGAGTTISDNTIFDAGSAANSVNISGSHANGVNTTSATLTGAALAVASGQRVCFNGLAECLSYDGSKITVITSAGSMSVNDNGDVSASGVITPGSSSYVTPTTGATVTIANHTPGVDLNPSGTLATLTVVLPSSPVNGQTCQITTTQTITSLSLSSPGVFIYGNITTLGIPTYSATFKYVSGFNYWIRVS